MDRPDIWLQRSITFSNVNCRYLNQSDSYSFWYHRRGNKSVSITNNQSACSLLFVCIIQLPKIWKLILLRFLVFHGAAIKLRGKHEDYSKFPDSWAFLACLRPFDTPEWIQIHDRLPPFPRGKLSCLFQLAAAMLSWNDNVWTGRSFQVYLCSVSYPLSHILRRLIRHTR